MGRHSKDTDGYDSFSGDLYEDKTQRNMKPLPDVPPIKEPKGGRSFERDGNDQEYF